MGTFNPNNETFLDGLEWIYGTKADGTPNYGWEDEGDKMKVTVFTEEPKALKEMLQTIGQIEKD
ncbi:hypothetical protein DER46DRAFT_663983 [Fusarium sp. MPI-SDFR-AT-0072]|nr:hypothetical protein DER46DRAFT_663983 [Fusarium sp. MPI-SDFR-AT-0072]